MTSEEMLYQARAILVELNERGDSYDEIDARKYTRWLIDVLETIEYKEDTHKEAEDSNFNRSWEGGEKP